jgi:hypothetical protein
MKKLIKNNIEKEISEAEDMLREPDERAIRLWERIRIAPQLWSQEQYPDNEPFWVIAAMGHRCLYFNHVEGGWGWGLYEQWGKVSEYHWEVSEIQHVVFQTLFSIDNGGKG